ncbi:MAG: UvrD-helicase domain-containing protein [Bacteroidota bacterium]
MDTPNIILILFVACLLIILITYIVVHQNKKILQRKLEAERLYQERQEQERIRFELAEAKRLKEKAIIKGMYQDILLANKKFRKFISFKDGYFNNNKLSIWKASVNSLYIDLRKYKIETLQLDNTIVLDIKELRNSYDAGEAIRSTYNKKFIERELKECDALFSNIDGQSLDEQQRLAVIKDEDNNLVIAGAGSGKTTTVSGKVSYVIDRFNVSPEDILLITFTKKASDEMKHRIKQKMNIDIEVNTFHSFGRKVIGEATNNMPSVIEEKQFYTEIRNIFNSLFKDSIYAHKVQNPIALIN